MKAMRPFMLVKIKKTGSVVTINMSRGGGRRVWVPERCDGAEMGLSTTGTSSMSWIRPAAVLVLAIAGWQVHPAFAAQACPIRAGHPLNFVDVFDGPAQELATLVPDKAGERSGYW